MSGSDDVFKVFISHKHEDHSLAVAVMTALQGLVPGQKEQERQGAAPVHIDCFVSGVDITAGMDWRREIRTSLAQSHLLILLFTAPSKNWDWCLYEAGLYTRFDRSESRSVVCLYNPADASPSPLADLQGVPAEKERVRSFLELLCRRTWDLSDEWRRGALAPDITLDQLDDAATAIETAFRQAGSSSTYYPCHRLVLSFTDTDDFSDGIPESAIVVEGPTGTSSFTMSLFNLAGGTGRRCWGDLLRAVDGSDSPWRAELDGNFLQALQERLFAPFQARLRAGDRGRGEERSYSVIPYSIVRGPVVGQASSDLVDRDRRPRALTLILQPDPRPARATTAAG